jgi:glutamate carboxypeptidase
LSADQLAAAVGRRHGEMFDFLEHVVNLDSPSEDKVLADAVGDVFQARAEGLRFAFERDPQVEYGDNRVGRLAASNPAVAAPRVLIIGHYDTVFPSSVTATWKYRTDATRAYGPGVLDMKGGLVIGLWALIVLQDVGLQTPAITVILNSDEEPGSPKSRDVILREAADHDLALVLEPGRPGPAITVGRKGVGIFRFVIDGVEAHAGVEPEKGANAIVEASHKAVELYALNDLAIGTSVTPGVVAGGTHPYVVPGRSELALDIRVPTLAEQERILAALDRIAGTTHVPGTRTRLLGRFHRPPMAASERTWEYIRLFQAASEKAGYPLGTATSGGASDANLTAAAGVPTIDGLGPDGGRAHSTEEYIELASVPRRAEALARFLAALASPTLRDSLNA